MKNHKWETFSIRTTGTTERTQSLRKAHSMPKGVLSGSPSAAGAVRESEGGRVNAHALDDLPNIGAITVGSHIPCFALCIAALTTAMTSRSLRPTDSRQLWSFALGQGFGKPEIADSMAWIISGSSSTGLNACWKLKIARMMAVARGMKFT